jgi:hypothetical protein
MTHPLLVLLVATFLHLLIFFGVHRLLAPVSLVHMAQAMINTTSPSTPASFHFMCRGVAWLLYLSIFVLWPLFLSAFEGGGGETIWIKNRVSRTISAPAATCKRFIQDASNLRKMTKCPIATESKVTLLHTKNGGIDASMNERNPHDAFRFKGGGGFHIEEQGLHATTISYYERYGCPIVLPLVHLVAGPWGRWHKEEMKVEMEIICAKIEALSSNNHHSAHIKAHLMRDKDQESTP